MARTNTLRALVVSLLNNIKTQYGIVEISFKNASPNAMYPHLVYDFTTTTPMDMGREDRLLDVHIWTKDRALSLEIQDEIIDLFSFNNLPQDTILPTFYFESAGSLDDPDRTICHDVVRFQIQNYERS